MANHSSSNGDMNHQNTYSINSKTWLESLEMEHSGIATVWSSEEQAILEDGLTRYSSESIPSISLYAKIASELQHKTVRDVAMRCSWIKSRKKKEEDHNGSGRASVDNKETLDVVGTSNSAPRLLREEDRIILELLNQNDQFFDQINADLTSNPSKLPENLMLFYKTRENLNNLLKKTTYSLRENALEPMKRMPWPEKLSDVVHDELIDFILLPSTSTNQPLPEEGNSFDPHQLLQSIIFPPPPPKQP